MGRRHADGCERSLDENLGLMRSAGFDGAEAAP